MDSVPSLGFFRNGHLLMFDGAVEENPVGALKFLTDLSNVLLPGSSIEGVGVGMLEAVMRHEGHVFAFLYAKGDGRARKVLDKLEDINDNLENDKV